MKDFFNNMLSTLLITCLFFYFGGVLINQEKEINQIEEETKHYRALLDEAKAETEVLKEEKSCINTDEYIEECARDRGLVMPNEIVIEVVNI
jgi:cell division protein FtsB